MIKMSMIFLQNLKAHFHKIKIILKCQKMAVFLFFCFKVYLHFDFKPEPYMCPSPPESVTSTCSQRVPSAPWQE